jgi:copper transport protein
LVLTATLAWPWQDAGRDWWVNLLVKSALVGAAFALGAWHHRRVRAGSDIGWASVVAEVAVMATVLAAAATLTQHTPAAVVAQRAAVTAAGSTADEAVGPATYPLSFDDGSTGELELVPRAGNESMWMLTLTGADGKPLAAQTVAVGIANPRAGVEQLAVTLDGMSDHWMGANTIPFAGSWSVAVAVYLDEFTVVNANTTMEIAG